MRVLTVPLGIPSSNAASFGRETVENRGLDDRSKLRCEPLERDAEVAVLDADQHVLLGRFLVVMPLRPQPIEQGASRPEPVQKMADADPPQPSCDLTGAAIVVGRPARP